MRNLKLNIELIILVIFFLFLGLSEIFNFELGIKMRENFFVFFWDMILIIPPAFVLIGLFNKWANREIIERHLGHSSGVKKYIWSVVLAATTVGGTFVAFPVANALFHKGAKYSSILVYVSSASLVMIPMTVIEASILGVKFSLIRLAISIPLVILTSSILGRFLEKSKYLLPKK
jgi:uncharacterized membrane protein YraQ (UPF0718 family)